MSTETEETKPPKCDECTDNCTRLILHRGTNEMHRIKCPCQYKLPVQFLFQQKRASCMPTCAAMIAGISEDKMIRQYYKMGHDFTKNGSSLPALCQILDKHFGFAYQTRYEHYTPTGALWEPWPCEPWADLILCEVENLRAANMHGVILLRDGRVLDPGAGVIDGLHLYPRVTSMTAFYKVST